MASTQAQVSALEGEVSLAASSVYLKMHLILTKGPFNLYLGWSVEPSMVSLKQHTWWLACCSAQSVA